MNRPRLKLPHWTTHPGFGVLILFVLAVVLIAHGEPQPSSRPSGTSVGVRGMATSAGSVPPLLVIRSGRVQTLRQRALVTVAMPSGSEPLAIVTGRGLSVVLAAVAGHQRAYAISSALHVNDLGLADAVIPAATGTAAVVVERALTDPGLLPVASSAPGSGSSSLSATPSGSTSAATGQPDLRDFSIRRYDSAGREVGVAMALPIGTRIAADSSVGLTVWQPVNRVFDSGLEQESLSAAAFLIRPDGTLRDLGPVHPLAANSRELLVWDVAVRRFGVMPLRYVTSTATSTATPSVSASADGTRPGSGSETSTRSSSPSATPTTVAGVRWFLPTRGMLLVTGPAAFNSDGSAFAVYAQVGSRRRLVVAQLSNLGTDLVEVLVLAQPTVKTSAVPPPSGTSATVISPSPVATTTPAPPTSTAPGLAPDGYPIAAPLTPLWWNSMVVALGPDGTVIGYRPGSTQSSLLSLGVTGVDAVASLP